MDKPHAARPTIKFIDEYCAAYEICFQKSRKQAFNLHVGMISQFPRKTPCQEFAKLDQNLITNHFLTKSPWSVKRTEKAKLDLILRTLKGEKSI